MSTHQEWCQMHRAARGKTDIPQPTRPGVHMVTLSHFQSLLSPSFLFFQNSSLGGITGSSGFPPANCASPSLLSSTGPCLGPQSHLSATWAPHSLLSASFSTGGTPAWAPDILNFFELLPPFLPSTDNDLTSFMASVASVFQFSCRVSSSTRPFPPSCGRIASGPFCTCLLTFLPCPPSCEPLEGRDCGTENALQTTSQL